VFDADYGFMNLPEIFQLSTKNAIKTHTFSKESVSKQNP
jgi:hypothetical protein